MGLLQEVLALMTPLNFICGVLGSILAFHIVNCILYSVKVYRAEGVTAPKLAKIPFTDVSWLYKIGMAQAKNRLPEFIQESFAIAGTNVMEVNPTGTMRYIVTQEPEHVKTILTGKFADFGKGEDFHRVWRPFLGDSIFTTDGRQWQDSRNLIRPMFIKNRVSDLHIFERWTQTMMSKFPAPGETFNIQELFYRMTIDVITEFLLGESVDSLNHPRSDFVQAFSDVQRAQTMMTVLLPVEKLVPRGKYRRDIAIMDNFITPFISRALALDPLELEKLSKSDRDFTFLHALALYTRDPAMIRDQITAVLLAGRDTTAATLSWTMYELAHQPAIYAKLRAEILAVVGPDRAPTYDDLKSMRYLTHTLNETLRLYPAVPFNLRFALADSTLPGVRGTPDITVVKGDCVLYSPLVMQRRAELYPPISEHFAPVNVFSPDRWENWQPPPWQYLPFNGGPRICVGQNFALTEMAFVMVRLLQRFETLEYRGDWEGNYVSVEIVGCPGRGVPIALGVGKE